jgi:hypothetical protein
MVMTLFRKLWLLSPAFVVPAAWGASPYQPTAELAAQWLSAQRNADGSRGASEDVKLLYTSAAVRALAVANQRQDAYYAGTTWLESRAGANVDFVARRVGALSAHGDSLANAVSFLQNAQASDGTTYSGWGLSESYSSAAFDTAQALLAYADLGSTAQVQPALDYLKNVRLAGANDKDWGFGSVGANDPLRRRSFLSPRWTQASHPASRMQ